jgi:hypothetical protein
MLPPNRGQIGIYPDLITLQDLFEILEMIEFEAGNLKPRLRLPLELDIAKFHTKTRLPGKVLFKFRPERVGIEVPDHEIAYHPEDYSENHECGKKTSEKFQETS